MELRFAKEHGIASSVEEYLRLSVEVHEDMMMLMAGENQQQRTAEASQPRSARHGR